jgi:hypothetical protein
VGGQESEALRLWIPLAVVALVAVAFLYFYALSASETEGATSFGLANVVGLLGVLVALIAAGFIFRRATPQR